MFTKVINTTNRLLQQLLIKYKIQAYIDSKIQEIIITLGRYFILIETYQVFNIKYNKNSAIIKYKARLVI